MTMSCNWWETAGCNLLVFAVATAVTFQHDCLACSRDFCFCAKEDAEDQANRAAASKLNNPGFDEEADEREMRTWPMHLSLQLMPCQDHLLFERMLKEYKVCS